MNTKPTSLQQYIAFHNRLKQTKAMLRRLARERHTAMKVADKLLEKPPCRKTMLRFVSYNPAEGTGTMHCRTCGHGFKVSVE